MWVYYRQTSNYCRPVLTYWPKDWRRQWLADCWSCTAFCCDSFSLLRQLCTVGHGIFLYGPCKQLFVSELNNAYFSRHLFWNSVWVAKSCITVCLLFKHCDFLNIDISQGSVATCLGYDGVFKLRTESNSERILKIGWHLAKFFWTHSVHCLFWREKRKSFLQPTLCGGQQLDRSPEVHGSRPETSSMRTMHFSSQVSLQSKYRRNTQFPNDVLCCYWPD